MGTTTTPLTFEEFERLPDRPGKRELLKGKLIELPPAEMKHDRIARRIFLELHYAVAEAHARGQSKGLGEVCIESGYQLSGHSWLKPDVSVARPGQPEGKYLVDSPAIAIEVVSPSNSAADMDIKTELYFEFGALEVWLVYPKTRRVIVYEAGGSRVIRAHEAVTTPLLPGFSMPVKEMLGE